VLIPSDNVRDLEEIDPTARKALRFIPCKRLCEVLDVALLPPSAIPCAERTEGNASAPMFIPAGVTPQNHIRLSTKSES